MTPDDSPHELQSPGPDESGKDLDDLLAEYIDRANSGEALDPDRIVREHPALGRQIISELETFLDLGLTSFTDSIGTLGDYTLRRQIGRGGMGIVYDAWEGSMDRQVALKVLPPGVAADERALQRFVREAKTAGQLSHRNVVSVYGMGLKEQTPYYAMEYVEGETLGQILTRLKDAEPGVETPFGPKEQVDYFAKLAREFAGVADGLQHAHSKGVIHRDVKPSNLILDSGEEQSENGHGRLRILDFGLARLEGQESLTLSGDFVGTPLYMSPEQARQRKIKVDHRTDVYSLGATLYEMLTGRPPFQGSDHQDTLSQIIERDPRPPRQFVPRIPGDLETIVLKCLRKDPGDRYGTAEALGQDLRRFVRGDPIEARPQAWWEVGMTRLWRARFRVTGLALLLITVIAVTLLALNSYQERRLETEREYVRQVESAVVKREMGRLAHRPGATALDMTDPFALLFNIDAFEEAVEERQIETALDVLAGAGRLLPTRPEAYYHRAVAWCLLDNIAEARRDIERSLRRDAEFAPARALLAAIESRERPGDSGAASTESLRRIQDAWQRAFAALLSGDRQEEARALSVLGRLATSETVGYAGGAIEWLLGSGTSLLAAGDPQGAVLRLAVAVDRWPEMLEPTLLLGQALLLLEEEEKARDLFENHFARVSETAGAADTIRDRTAIAVASVYRGFGEFEEGLRWATRISDLQVRERTRNDFLCHLRRFDEALQAGTQALAADPGDPRNYVYLCWAVYFCEAPTDEVRRIAEEEIQRNSESPAPHGLLACMDNRQGRLEEALKRFEHAGSLSPPNATVLIWHADALWFNARRLQDALEVLERGLELPTLTLNDRRGLLHNLSVVHRRLGDDQKSLEVRLQMIQLDPGQALNHALVARNLVRLGRLDDAQPYIERARTRGADDPHTRWELGDVFKDGGRFADARVEYEAAGELLWRLGQRERALGRFRRAVQTDSTFWARTGALDAFKHLGSFEDALTTALGGVRLDPSAPAPLHELVVIDRLSAVAGVPPSDLASTWDAVVEELEAIRAQGAANVPLLHAIARGYLRSGTRRDLSKARQCLQVAEQEALEPDPSMLPDWLATRAEVLRGEGRAAEAVSALEEALQLRDGDPVLLALHAECAREALPVFVSFRSIDVVLESSPRDEDAGLLRGFRAAAPPSNAEALGLYLEARMLQRSGSPREAAGRYRELLEKNGATPLLILRLAESLRDGSESEAAEEVLREALAGEAGDSRDLCYLWVRVCLDDLRILPRDLAMSLPVAEAGSGEAAAASAAEYADDLRWLLEVLGREDVIRIDCGASEDMEVGGAAWSRDRFFLRGSHSRSDRGEVLKWGLSTPFEAERQFPREKGLGGFLVPLPKGQYSVTLHFLERWWKAAGLRRFTVKLEGEERLEDFDPFVAAGFGKPHSQSYNVTVSDGALDIEFIAEMDTPNIAGIEIRPMRE